MDELYIKRVLNGDLEAFGYLVRQHQAMALRTAVAIVKNEVDAKDIVQNSFLQAFESLHSFRLEARFSSWLFRIVVNKSLRFLQRKGQNQAYTEQAGLTPTAQNQGLLSLNQADLGQLLRDGLSKLPPKEALCIQLFYLEEYHLSEIVEVTGFSKSNVKVLLHRGRKHLHQHLITSYKSIP